MVQSEKVHMCNIHMGYTTKEERGNVKRGFSTLGQTKVGMSIFILKPQKKEGVHPVKRGGFFKVSTKLLETLIFLIHKPQKKLMPKWYQNGTKMVPK